jgi:hypothetical protein
VNTIRFFAVVLFLLVVVSQIEAQTKEKTGAVEVYYFHGTHRCATCNAVEKVTKEALKQYYGDQISLKSINREEDKNNSLIQKYQIAGQTLLILKGNKKEDLTNLAFMNAERSPYRLKTKIKETIDKMK